MSYLNSLLSSIESGTAPPTSPTVSGPPRTNSPRTVANGTTGNGGVSGSAPPAKRKAEGDTGAISNKMQRRDSPSVTSGSSRPSSAKPVSKPAPVPSTYQGTARPNSTGPTTSKPATTITTTKPIQSTSKSATNGAPPMTGTTAPPPKKGSFAEIMARAKAAQQTAPTSIGAIKHKPVEKMSKKERLAKQQEEMKKRKQEIKDARSGQMKRSRSPEKGKATAGAVQKERRPTVDLGYKGTMRPSATAPAYKGTMRPSAPATRSPAPTSSGPKGKVRMAGYASYSENSDDEMHSDDWDDESDMEAGAFDVDEEEELSLRAAKKEDAAALREENELKRRKLERKNMASRR